MNIIKFRLLSIALGLLLIASLVVHYLRTERSVVLQHAEYRDNVIQLVYIKSPGFLSFDGNVFVDVNIRPYGLFSRTPVIVNVDGDTAARSRIKTFALSKTDGLIRVDLTTSMGGDESITVDAFSVFKSAAKTSDPKDSVR